MYIADLHIHSRYSRATSRDCDAPRLDYWARMKGIRLVGTGDFTHPQWREDLKACLEPAEEGFYRLREECRLPCPVAGEVPEPRFVVTGEISTIYKKDGKTRKVHHLILLPGLEAAEDLAHRLEAVGNLHSDGRPILGLDSRDLLEIVLESCPEAVYIPAHIWTPHFSLFGAFSGFDSLEECFGDLSGHVHALETGLSSDPPMNRRLSALDKYLLVSNSDAHSPAKLGREANLLEGPLGYPALKRALDTGEGLRGTIEFYPEEGKYHLDGHRACGCRLEPAETRRLEGRCPVCGRRLTVGVLHRVEELADRAEPGPADGRPFERLMPLPELLADSLGASPASKRVQAAYLDALSHLGPEFAILRELPPEALAAQAGEAAGEALRRLRAGAVRREAGYDGEYGKITLFAPRELEQLRGQLVLPGLSALPVRRKRAIAPVRAARSENDPAEQPRDASPERLNPAQEAAVRSQAPVTVVVAGPGTGKTRTLAARVAHLIREEGVAPERVTAVTFTRQAAREMRERLAARLGAEALKGLTVGTFHAVCLGLLPEKPILTEARIREELKALLAERGIGQPSPAECARLISARKNGLPVPAEALPEGLYEAYQARLASLGVRDLDDALLEGLEIDPRSHRNFDYLLVDEFQDINPLQRRLVERWSAGSRNLFVIGDPDQSIYGFRGADARCFEALLADHPRAEVITLTENYRSSPAVLESALAVIGHNPGPVRDLRAVRANAAPVRVVLAPDELNEGIWIAGEIARMAGGTDMLEAQENRAGREETRSFSEIAVLCRTRRQLEQIETCLVHDSIPCVVGGRDDSLEDRRVQALLDFFRGLADPRDSLALAGALTGLFACPEGLARRAAEALRGGLEAPDPEDLAADFQRHAPLKLWLEAAREFRPRLEREKPRRLLEQLAKRAKIKLSAKPMERLLNTAVFHDTMADLLREILLGGETGLNRASDSRHASGAVRLMTLHGAKGLEFPVVFLAGVAEGRLPLERQDAPADPEEERRLFFVGMTRAREELILSCGGAPSPFLAELPASVRRENAPARTRLAQGIQLRMF